MILNRKYIYGGGKVKPLTSPRLNSASRSTAPLSALCISAVFLTPGSYQIFFTFSCFSFRSYGASIRPIRRSP